MSARPGIDVGLFDSPHCVVDRTENQAEAENKKAILIVAEDHLTAELQTASSPTGL